MLRDLKIVRCSQSPPSQSVRKPHVHTGQCSVTYFSFILRSYCTSQVWGRAFSSDARYVSTVWLTTTPHGPTYARIIPLLDPQELSQIASTQHLWIWHLVRAIGKLSMAARTRCYSTALVLLLFVKKGKEVLLRLRMRCRRETAEMWPPLDAQLPV